MPETSSVLPMFSMEDGSLFDPEERIESEVPAFAGYTTTELRTFVANLWSEAFEGKRAETERLKTCSLYYDGFHYTNAWLNRKHSIENYCFSTVETVWPIMTEARPRAKISPRNAMAGGDTAMKLRETAQWLMDTDEFDRAYRVGMRDMLKYGWNCWFIGIDPNTGMPFPKNVSVFDTYPDPTAREFSECEYIFTGQSVNTARLQSFFPDAAHLILPDNVASPAYDVHVRPFYEYLEHAYRYEGINSLSSSLNFAKESEAPATTSTALVPSTGNYREYGKTTFLLQLYVRDLSLMKVLYMGTLKVPDQNGKYVEVPGSHMERMEPCCPSGWRVISMTYNGQFVEPAKPLDAAFLGDPPFVWGMNYEQTDRLWPTGELDHVIPVQRGINRYNALMDRMLELVSNPPVITNQDSGLPADISAVAAGDVMRIRRGSEVKMLEIRGPSEYQFNALTAKKRAVDTVSGVHDVQQGERPAGIEAASAIRNLQQAAAVRVRGKENGASGCRAKLVKKLLSVAGKKLKEPLWFHGAGGKGVQVDPEELLLQYDIQFEDGSGTTAGQQESLELAMQLFQSGAIDEQALLEAANWPNAQQVAARMAIRKMQEAVAMAKQKAQNPPPGESKK